MLTDKNDFLFIIQVLAIIFWSAFILRKKIKVLLFKLGLIFYNYGYCILSEGKIISGKDDRDIIFKDPITAAKWAIEYNRKDPTLFNCKNPSVAFYRRNKISKNVKINKVEFKTEEYCV